MDGAEETEAAGRQVAVSEGGRGSRSVNTCPDSDVSNEMDNVFHDREGVCPMDAMRKLAEV